MEHNYSLDAMSCSIRPTYIEGIEIVLSEEDFQWYVQWYKNLDGNIPDFFDSPLWNCHMDDFNEAVGYRECDVDYPDGFLDDLAEAAKKK